MQYTDNFNSIFHRTIKDDVTSDRKTPHLRRQFLALSPDLRHRRQLGKPRDDAANEFVRCFRVVLRDVKPDFVQV